MSKKDNGAVAPNSLTAYNVRTKQKGVPMSKAVINQHGNRYVATGLSPEGDKLAVILGKDKAEAAIKAGTAKWGTRD